MTDPLIDRDSITRVLDEAVGASCRDAANDVMAYLREVLTPEALWPQPEPDDDPDEGVPRSTVRLVNSLLIPETIHCRIFGEDK